MSDLWVCASDRLPEPGREVVAVFPDGSARVVDLTTEEDGSHLWWDELTDSALALGHEDAPVWWLDLALPEVPRV